MITKWLILVPLLFVSSHAMNKLEERQHWWNLGQNELLAALNVRDNWNVAKNVIMFLGDGMGITANTAGRIYKGQKKGMNGEEGYLAWERFPNAALLKTYNVDKQVPDSAATATAFLCGIKTNFYTLGVDSAVTLGDCKASQDKATHTSSILHWAQDAGKDTGIVTTTRITHATPGATYAHSAHRNWECDATLGDEGKDCKDIAEQLVHNDPGKDIKVILGGGRQPMGAGLSKVGNFTCIRKDGRNLAKEWVEERRAKGHEAQYVTTQGELESVDINKTDFLMGLFADSHMPFEIDRTNEPSGSPSLTTMTLTAINMLKKSDKGFFLLVEGGRIDHALHDNLPRRALEETMALDEAVSAALKEVDLEETLVVVTADHSHVMTINGYPNRGNDILGLVNDVSMVDGLPYTTLMFTNGPGYNYTVKDGKVQRHDPSTVDVRDKDYRSQAAVPMPPISETHGGEDVAIWAAGPMAHLFHRTHEQHYVAHAMAYSACIGPSKDKCTRPPHATFTIDVPKSSSTSSGSSSSASSSSSTSFSQRKGPTSTPRTPTTPPKPAPTTTTTTTTTSQTQQKATTAGVAEASARFPGAPTHTPTPKFPTLSPVLQQLLNNNEEKIVTALGTESIASFSSAVTDLHKLIGKSVIIIPHSM